MCDVNFGRWALLAIVVVLGGCGGRSSDEVAPPAETAPSIVQPGAPGEPTRTLLPAEVTAIRPSVHTPTDVRFMRGMIHHHAQALRLTSLVPRRSGRTAIETLARRIDASQEAEIEQMSDWLEERGEQAPVLHRAHGHAHGAGRIPMPGVLTEPELTRLAAAQGTAFDRLFLRSMIRHHEGALSMVRDLYGEGGGLEPAADAFARHVDSDQLIEIARMEQLLAGLG